MNLPTNPSNAIGHVIGRIRDRLQFDCEYWCAPFTLRVYRTRDGVYGPQYQAILWTHDGNGPWVGCRTTGCGYDKQAAAVASVMHAAGYSGVVCASGLATAWGVDPYTIHHACG